MINKSKLALFIIVSILFFVTIFGYAQNKIVFSVLYLIFILVGLYDYGDSDETDIAPDKIDEV